jgi:hypothetical protein
LCVQWLVRWTLGGIASHRELALKSTPTKKHSAPPQTYTNALPPSMDSTASVRVEKGEGGVFTVILHRPKEKNAVDRPTAEALVVRAAVLCCAA